MVIQKIKDSSQGLIAKIIVGGVALTFALFGVDAIIGFTSNEVDVASVNGEEITDFQLARTAENYRQRLLGQLGENMDPNLIDEQILRNRALTDLIEREVLLQDAEDQDLYISGRRIDQIILQTSAFQADGQFSPQLYEFAVRNAGMTPLDYKNQLSRDLLLQQPQAALISSGFVTRTEIDQLVRLDRQKRNIAYLSLPAANFLDGISISEREIEDFYQANEARFTTEDMVQVEYVELQRSDFYTDVEVEEAEIVTAYQQEVASYEQREERRAAHILLGTDERSTREAREHMQQILDELQAGADFAELARTHSEDPGSAEQGGDLGFSERGVYDPAFEQALFALEQEGDVSAMVETEFGLHLIKLLGARKPEIPGLDERRDALRQVLLHQKSEQLYIAALETLENEAFSSNDLTQPAESLNLPIQTSDFFPAQGGDGIAANAQVARAAFSTEVLVRGNNSEPIEIGADHVVVLHVKEHRPSALKSLAEVRDEIEGELKNAAAAERARAEGETIISALRQGTSPADVTLEHEVEWTIQDDVTRNDPNLNPEIVEQAFKLPKPSVGDKSIGNLTLSSGDYLVLLLTRVEEENTLGMEAQEITAIRQFLSNQYGSNEFEEYKNSLIERANIRYYNFEP